MTETTEIGNQLTPVEWRETPLTKADRCDTGKCGSEALVRTFHKIENDRVGDLLWCGHHYHKNETALAPVTVHVQDERGNTKLNAEDK